MTKILFISWDGPQTSYMEGLFFPIFEEIQKQSTVEFHVLHFTWANNVRKKLLANAAKLAGIQYTAVNIHRKPIATIGSFLTVLKGDKIIQKYIKKHHINILMPRSTMPAMMVNRLNQKGLKIIFDADGLPIDERVDFARISKDSFRYRYLKDQESKLLKRADLVLTRTQKSLDIHVGTIGESSRDKFFVVTNGRNIQTFKLSLEKRKQIRESLKLERNDMLWVYCGSLGPQYGWEEMLNIFTTYHKKHSNSRFLILTNHIEFARSNISDALRESCIIKSLPFAQVPDYLSAADIAFAIRKPTYSMQAVAPIKLGEYILMGLPTIASKGIGDSEEILNEIKGNFLFDHQDFQNIAHAVKFAENLNRNAQEIRKAGIAHFSIEQSAQSYIRALEKLYI